VALHGNCGNDGKLLETAVGPLKAWVIKYSDNKARPELVEQWVRLPTNRGFILPNSVDLGAYRMGPKNRELMVKYGLQDKRLLMTVGRLVSSERYKGFDEVIEAMPALLRIHADLAYLIVGEGNDRARLENKARQYGVADRVIFAGYISDGEKCDHYNLAEAFVMPSRGEGFGIVLLEAMACGVPVVGSTLDGSREALRDGKLGVLVDPSNIQSVVDGILDALRKPHGIPDGLEYFSFDSFEARTHRLLATW
jgi:glycosyltransferase involved in cell wall biosynthesis